MQVSAIVQALATEGFLTVLAEPNLTAVSGQTASFLAGGEFPVPVVQNVSAGTLGDLGPVPAIRRAAGLYADDHRRQPSEPAGSPGGQPAEHSGRGDDQRVHDPGADRTPRGDLGRARQRAKLRARRPAAAQHRAGHLQGPLARRHPDPRRAISFEQVSEQRDRAGHHHHPLSRQADGNAPRRRRPTALRSRTTRSRCCGATPGGGACRGRRAGRSTPAAAG